jgi:arsenate reductase-like glutaredoxin family protein
MHSQPVLINRPIVVTPRGVLLCRPPETVLKILPPAGAGPTPPAGGGQV